MPRRKKQKEFSPAIATSVSDSGFPRKEEQGGILFVVATPIGNLGDITQRAIRVLQEVSCVAAEDTRQTKKLLTHLDIHKKIISYYKHREVVKSQEIIKMLEQGESVALVSDAGTPCLSDPGAFLVRMVREHGFEVMPVPGVSALTAAISISGADAPFSFHGFLPGRRAQRKKNLQSLQCRDETLVFYESPRRILSFLEDIHDILGNRDILIARELTKIHEETIIGKVSEVMEALSHREKILGEFVVIVLAQIQKRNVNTVPEKSIVSLLTTLKREGETSMRDAVNLVSKELGVSRSLVYRQGLALWRKDSA